MGIEQGVAGRGFLKLGGVVLALVAHAGKRRAPRTTRPFQAATETLRCDARQIAALFQFGVNRIGKQPRFKPTGIAISNLESRFRLVASEPGIRLGPGAQRQFVLLKALIVEVDEIAEIVAVGGQLQAQAIAVVLEPEFELGRSFGIEIGVTQFVRLGGDMRAVGKEFFDGRRAFGAIDTRRERPRWAERAG